MRRIRGRPLLLFAFSALLYDCAALDKLPSGTCGNKVVDANEDCDGVPADRCGAPDSGVTACRLLCGGDKPACPAGWGCSVAGFCRQPKGEFSPASQAVSTAVSSMVVGDLDGDGRADIVAADTRRGDNSARTKVLYFGDGAALEHTTAISAPIASPSVYDFNGDGIDDFAFGAVAFFSGMDVMLGQKDRTLVPVTFPSVVVPQVEARPVQVFALYGAMPSSAGQVGTTSAFLFAGTTPAGVGLFAVDKNGNTLFRHKGKIEVGIDGYVAPPIWAHLFDADPAADGACGQVVLAMNQGGHGHIEIVSPCRRICDRPDPSCVTWAPDGDPIASVDTPDLLVPPAIFVGDLDGERGADGKPHVDIAIGTETKVHFVKGDGTPGAMTLANAGLPVLREIVGGAPLAVGDLDLDGRPEIVVPRGVLFRGKASGGGGGVGDAGADGGAEGGLDGGIGSFDGGLSTPAVTIFDTTFGYGDPVLIAPRRWSRAAIGAFNADGLADLVAGSSDSADLDFFSGTTTQPFWVASTIPTDGPLAALAEADYDGDGLVDHAIATSRPGTTSVGVSIAYGSISGPPERPVSAARIEDFVAMPAFNGGGSPESIPLFGYQPAAAKGLLKTMTASIVLGSGDRLPLSPLVLGELGAAAPNWYPMVVAAAPVLDPTKTDLVALGVQPGSAASDDARLWISASSGTASNVSAAFARPQAANSIASRYAAFDPLTLKYQASVALGDLDGDGLAEAVVVSRAKKASDPLTLSVYRPTPSKGADDPGPDPVTYPLTGIATAADARDDTHVELLDVDGDGARDVFLVLTSSNGSDPTTRRAFVIRNVGKALDVAKAIPFVVPDLPSGDPGPLAATMITTAAPDRDGNGALLRTLVVVTKNRIVFAQLKPDGSFALTDETTRLFGKNGLVDASDVASGDFDGDGVVDLAVADGAAVRIVRQEAVK